MFFPSLISIWIEVHELVSIKDPSHRTQTRYLQRNLSFRLSVIILLSTLIIHLSSWHEEVEHPYASIH